MNNTDPYLYAPEETPEPEPLLSELHAPEDWDSLAATIDKICLLETENE